MASVDFPKGGTPSAYDYDFAQFADGNSGPCRLCCGGLAEDIKAIQAEWKDPNCTEGKCNAVFGAIRLPLACGRAGANILSLPMLVEFATRIATAVRFAIDKTRLGAATLALGIVGLVFCVVDMIRICRSVEMTWELKRSLDSRSTDQKKLTFLQDTYFEPGGADNKDLCQSKYLRFVNRIRPHIAKELFTYDVDFDQKIGEGARKLSDEEAAFVGKLTDKKILDLIDGIKNGNDNSIKRARYLLERVDIIITKLLVYHALSILSFIITIVGLSFGFANFSPNTVIILMGVSIFLSLFTGLFWCCCVESKKERLWELQFENLVPDCLNDLKIAVHNKWNNWSNRFGSPATS